jgi:hypothetical protein
MKYVTDFATFVHRNVTDGWFPDLPRTMQRAQ